MTDPGTTSRENVLVLYTELAPYVLACFAAWSAQHNVNIHLVHWPVNTEAPFALEFAPGVMAYDRATLDDKALLELALRLSPRVVMASGWVDKGYLKACRALKKKGVHSVMSFDTAWRGTLKQWANVILSRFTLSRTFSHAWVTGALQQSYARRLGFRSERIKTGFYSADTARFLPLGERLLAKRSTAWPKRFLCVARYIPSKGHQLLCDAFAELCDAGEAGDWELWMTGAGELQEQVMSSSSGKHERITHLGFKQANEMQDVVEQCGVLVLPSTFEPWGVVVHEHACAGLPMILSSEVGAADRFLVEGGNGHRFIAGDMASLKGVLRMMMRSSSSELHAMGVKSAALGCAWTPSDWARTASELMTRNA
ncbi:MAG: glycosyltransferase family 4 protein [Flavobacteriales bacterium]|nr:glycosyltransferase family 4 protein [Flavobacteriales bacterium]